MARIVEKDPDVDATYIIEWTNQLATGVTIAGSTWTLPTDLTETTSSNTTTTTSITVGGGVAGTTYVTLSAGGPYDYTLYVLVSQQIMDEVRQLPLSLSEIKHYLRVTTDEDDANILEILKAAVDYVETVTGRDLVSKTSTVLLPRFDSCFELDSVPIRSVARIRYYDNDNLLQTLAVDQYSTYVSERGTTIIEPAIGVTWPGTANRGDAIELLIVSGYGPSGSSVPADAKLLIKMIARGWYDNPAGAVTGTIFTPTKPSIDALIWKLKSGYYADV